MKVKFKEFIEFVEYIDVKYQMSSYEHANNYASNNEIIDKSALLIYKVALKKID